MGFLFKRANSGSRRNAKVWWGRLKFFMLYVALPFAIIGFSAVSWMDGAVTRAVIALENKTLQTTASAGFRVNEILITGRHAVSQQDILTQLNLVRGTPLFGVSLKNAQEKLAALSWVKDVSVSRRLPDKIVVSMKERTPVALWQYQKKISLIDETGAVLVTESLDRYQGLPLVVGPAAGESVAPLLSFLTAEPALAEIFSSATRVGNRRWDLRLKNGLVIKLPEKDEELALRKLMAAEEQGHLFGKNVTTIDLRLPDRLVVDAVAEQTPGTPKTKTKKQNI